MSAVPAHRRRARSSPRDVAACYRVELDRAARGLRARPLRRAARRQRSGSPPAGSIAWRRSAPARPPRDRPAALFLLLDRRRASRLDVRRQTGGSRSCEARRRRVLAEETPEEAQRRPHEREPAICTLSFGWPGMPGIRFLGAPGRQGARGACFTPLHGDQRFASAAR